MPVMRIHHLSHSAIPIQYVKFKRNIHQFSIIVLLSNIQFQKSVYVLTISIYFDPEIQTIRNEFGWASKQMRGAGREQPDRTIDWNTPVINESHFIISLLHNESISITLPSPRRAPGIGIWPGGHLYVVVVVDLDLIVNKAKTINTYQNRIVIIKEKSLIEFPRMPQNVECWERERTATTTTTTLINRSKQHQGYKQERMIFEERKK